MAIKHRITKLEKFVNKTQPEGPLTDLMVKLAKEYPATPGDKRNPLKRFVDSIMAKRDCGPPVHNGPTTHP